MLRPAIVTASDSGLSRAPPQVVQGRNDMNCSTLSRTAWDIDVACWRRSCGMTPSNQPQLPPLRRAPRKTRSRRRGPCRSRVRWALGQVAPRHLEVDVVLLGDHVEEEVVVVRGAVGPRQDRPVGQAAVGIDHQLRIDLGREAEPGALGAGPVGRVEGEGPRGQLRQRRAVLRAGEALGVGPRPGGLAVGGDLLDPDEPVGQPGRGLQAVAQAPAQVVPHDQPVHHDLDRVVELLVQRRHLVERVDDAVDRDPGEALAADLLEHVPVLALAVAHQGREDQEPGALRERQHLVGDLLHALAGDRPPADGAVRLADPGEQQPQVVVDLGDRRDRGARVAARGLLVDRDRRREALDVVDVRLVHLAEELAGVGREALDVAPLPLGVERVERQARLPAPREAGDHHQIVARDLHRDVAQVVLPGTHDTDGIGGCRARRGHQSSVVAGPVRMPGHAPPARAWPGEIPAPVALAAGTYAPDGEAPTVSAVLSPLQHTPPAGRVPQLLWHGRRWAMNQEPLADEPPSEPSSTTT